MPAAAEAVAAGAPVGADEFAAAMRALGPFEPAPRLAVAVSGGADSMALAFLGSRWAAGCGGTACALIVDHGLRPASASEAGISATRLEAIGIGARILTVRGLEHGSALADRARRARHAVLQAACREAGILHLLLGHHAGDQAETLMIRALSGSGNTGLAGMPVLAEVTGVRLLRPLLRTNPDRLRETLRRVGMGWVEDPSNADARALRGRLRAGMAAAANAGVGRRTNPARQALLAAATAAGASRAVREAAIAAALATQVSLHEAGFALLADGRIDPAALAALLRTISGADYAPSPASVAALAARPRPTTLAGVRLLPGGRLGSGLLVVREPAAMAPPVPARPGACWDGRFALGAAATPPAASTLGALGNDAAAFRHRSALPACILRTLPALRGDGSLIAVPHLGYPDATVCRQVPLRFSPSSPAAGAPFFPADGRT